MKKFVIYMLIGGLFMSGGCSGGTTAQKKPTTSKLNYEIVDTNSNEFKSNRELNGWYMDNYQAKGKYTKTLSSKTYILISAGQRSTGGYNMEIVDVNANDKIVVTTRVIEPQPDQIKTMVITYPHVLIAVPKDNRNIIWEEVTESK